MILPLDQVALPRQKVNMRCDGRVLVVDDEQHVRQVFRRYLESLGYQVVEAEDGQSGIARLRDSNPDLVVCDLRMPGVDGLAVLAAAKVERPDTPVIVMSGAGLLADAIGALKLGAWDYLAKPVASLEVLHAAVARAMEGAFLRRENRSYRAHLERANAELKDQLLRLEEDEEAGRQIQFRLLPENHQRFNDLEVSLCVIPSAHLSGDFVDCFSISPRHVCFYLADVAGHGVPSAFVTVLLKSFMQRHVCAADEPRAPSPGQVLNALNAELLKARVGKHLTIFFGVIDTSERTLAYSSAGQFPWPMLYDGKDLRLLDAKGLPAGLFDFSTYDDRQISLPESFLLTLCSDGVLELLSPPSLEEKTSELARAVSNLDLTVDRLNTWLAVEQKKPVPDDVAVLMIRNRESAHGHRA